MDEHAQEPRVITLAELAELIGSNTVVALDPRGDWRFDPEGPCWRHRDGRFFEVRMFDRGAYAQPGAYEEPSIEPEPGERRTVGTVKISVNPGGRVRVETARNLEGQPFIQAPLFSVSNPDAVDVEEQQRVRSARFQTNPQRIAGFVGAALVYEDFPDEDGMTVNELRMATADGRTLAALAALATTLEL